MFEFQEQIEAKSIFVTFLEELNYCEVIACANDYYTHR